MESNVKNKENGTDGALWPHNSGKNALFGGLFQFEQEQDLAPSERYISSHLGWNLKRKKNQYQTSSKGTSVGRNRHQKNNFCSLVHASSSTLCWLVVANTILPWKILTYSWQHKRHRSGVQHSHDLSLVEFHICRGSEFSTDVTLESLFWTNSDVASRCYRA